MFFLLVQHEFNSLVVNVYDRGQVNETPDCSVRGFEILPQKSSEIMRSN